MLDAGQIFHLDLHGYVIVRGAIPPDEVARLESAVAALDGKRSDELPPCAISSFTAVVNEFRVYNIVECGPEFERMVDHPAILPAVEQLVPGRPRCVEIYSITRRQGVGIPLHSLSVSQYHVAGGVPQSHYLKAVVSLNGSGPDDGPMVVFAGTHKLEVPFPYSPMHPDWRFPEHDRAWRDEMLAAVPPHLERRAWETIPGYTEVYTEPGDLILFSEDLWHGAKAKTTDAPRRTLYISYSPFHHPNWHGFRYSHELLARVTPRQRALLAGPFIGNRFEDWPTPELEGLGFMYMPNSERRRDDPEYWRRPAPAAPQPGDRAGLDAILGRDFPQRLRVARNLDGRDAACVLELRGPGGGTWTIDVGARSIAPGTAERPDAWLAVDAAAFAALFSGELDPVRMFYEGQLEARGDISLILRLADLWGPPPAGS